MSSSCILCLRHINDLKVELASWVGLTLFDAFHRRFGNFNFGLFSYRFVENIVCW
jgi:hypothetical protein